MLSRANRLRLALGLLILPTATVTAEEIRILVQRSSLAGSQFYALDRLAPQMRVGDPLTLIREPTNGHDSHAIRVEWHGQQLGYVPRANNRALAAAMDRGDRIVARIKELKSDADPWRRLRFEVFVVL